jgi:hypothetical protein
VTWIQPKTPGWSLRCLPVAYVTRCGRGLWLLGAYQTALRGLTFDAVICDPPYSARTHSGHDKGVNTAKSMKAWAERQAPTTAKRAADVAYRKRLAEAGVNDRRSIDYAAWSHGDVVRFMRWADRAARGWIVALCDHTQHLWYYRSAERRGRYAFYPVVWYAPGSRVRMSYDGPANWSCWIAVSRPRRLPFSKWGSLPGGYNHPTKADQNAGDYRIGGKPLLLMVDLVRDYSRPNDVVCDPTAGYATTGVAALANGRRFVGCEIDREAWEHGRGRLSRVAPTLGAASQPDPAQISIV